MKRMLTTILMAVGITGPFVAHLAAQSHRLVADIPFAFAVDNRTLPAGQYDVYKLNLSSSVFVLRDADGNGIFLQLGIQEDGKPGKPSLTFACYGNDRVLAKITPPDGMTAYALSRTSIEKNLHHTLGMASMVSIKLASR
jgi:hypothetical protein